MVGFCVVIALAVHIIALDVVYSYLVRMLIREDYKGFFEIILDKLEGPENK